MMWWDGHASGWAWVWMSISMVIFWGLIAAGIYWLVRTTHTPAEHRHTPEEHKPTAEDILAERFARGEISAQEFEERRRVLGSR